MARKPRAIVTWQRRAGCTRNPGASGDRAQTSRKSGRRAGRNSSLGSRRSATNAITRPPISRDSRDAESGRPGSSLDLDFQAAYETTILFGFALDQRAEILCRTGKRFKAGCHQPFFESGKSRDLRDIRLDAFDDLLRSTFRHDNACPDSHFESGISGFRNGRDVGQHRRSAQASYRKNSQASALDVGKARRDLAERHCDPSGKDLLYRWTAPLERYVSEIDTRSRLEQFHREMVG